MNPRDCMLQQLEIMYPDRAAAVADDVFALLEQYRHNTDDAPESGWSERDSFLITYGDSLLRKGQAPLQVLRSFLSQRVGDALSFVHILPFCPFTSDDGFSVVDYRAINPDLGDWDDVLDLARHYRMCYDAVVNHCSRSSVYMQAYLKGDPDYEDFFIALDPGTDTSEVTRPRNLPLLHEYQAHDGPRWLWTTFSEDQVDLNFKNPAVLLEMLDVLLYYARQGASMVRLDAITYFWKELGTTCVHLPETHAFVRLVRAVYDICYPHMLVLTETNVPHQENMSYFGNAGDEAQIIYNFTLSPLVAYTFAQGNAEKLNSWAATIKKVSDRATFLNMTATHDGIGVRPTEGILTDDERQSLCQRVEAHGGRVSYKANGDGSASPYELNITYFDMINDPAADEDTGLQVKRFLASQAIALSFIGIPAIYIHSLLGSRNDIDSMESSGINRRINREQLSCDVVMADIDKPGSRRQLVFDRYCELLRQRSQLPAFHPDAYQEVLDCGNACFVLRRDAGAADEVIAVISVVNEEQSIDLTAYAASISDVLMPVEALDPARLTLQPYQIRWLRVQ